MVGCWYRQNHNDGTAPAAPEHWCLQVSSNASMSSQHWWLVSMLLAAVTLLIALWLTVLGYWPILIAALLHLLLAGIGLRTAVIENRCSETICVEAEHISVVQQQRQRQRHWQQTAHWLRLALQQRSQRGIPALILHANGEQLELGRFLNEQEKATLLLQLWQRTQARVSAKDQALSRRMAGAEIVSRPL